MSDNIPKDIIQLQEWVLESSCNRYMAIQNVYVSPESLISGVDNICFTNASQIRARYKEKMLKGTRFAKSNKSPLLKKNLPKSAVITKKLLLQTEKEALKQNINLMLSLYNKCKLKTLRKKFQEDTVKRV